MTYNKSLLRQRDVYFDLSWLYVLFCGQTQEWGLLNVGQADMTLIKGKYIFYYCYN